uniref:AKNA domain-containing protein n=1 Tax=Sphenodon punctatus TaxID=8508 RepID=A0A8D0GER1_SPHPU
MASLPRDGSGRWQHWQEEEEDKEEEFEKHMDENGVIGMEENGSVGSPKQWEGSLARCPTAWAFMEGVKHSKTLASDQAEGERSFDFSDLQEFELGEPRGDRNSTRSPPLDDGEELEHDGTQEDTSSPDSWSPQRDQQLDMTEDEQDQGSMAGRERQRGSWEAGSEGDGYPELSYEGQCGSEYSTSPEALRDAQALYEYDRSFIFTSEAGEELSEHSIISPSPPRVPQERSHRPGHRRDTFDSLSQLGESQDFPAETELSSPSGGHPESPLVNSTSQNLLHYLSVEDLQNTPSIDTETFPEYSYAESVDDPSRNISTVTPAGRARASQLCPAQATGPSERPAREFRAARTPPALRWVGSQQPDRARKLKKTMSPLLPSKFKRQSRSLSPRGKKGELSGSPKPSHSRPALNYGRGQLNYPLPYLSKVEPRVKFPKDDQGYRPPRGRTLPMKTRGSASPVIFKSPAEIVREVLLSSGEGSPQKCPTPTIAMVPEEFKSPKQATELVQQLQEDYHKLLTKYAEAENTIDRLRLGARVSLYADPPKPGHSVHIGTVSHGSKVITFSIPQVRKAEPLASSSSTLAPKEGSPSVSGEQVVSSLTHSGLAGLSGEDRIVSSTLLVRGDSLTQTLAAQAGKCQTQVESFEELLQSGGLTPQEQLKAFARLKKAQDALEKAYLQAREEHHQGPGGTFGGFDPHRVVEGEIFCLGMRLEELKDGIDHAAQSRSSRRSSSEPASSPHSVPTQVSKAHILSPTPSVQAPIPAVRTPYPEAPIPKDSRSHMQVDAEVSSASSEAEEGGEELPEPLRHRQLQVEQGFDHLLSHYNSFKSLPESLSLERLHLEGDNSSHEEDTPDAKDAGMERPHRKLALKEETTHVTSQLQPSEMKLSALPPGESPKQTRQSSRLPSVQAEESLPRSLSTKAKSPAVMPKPSFEEQRGQLSRQSSMASMAESTISEHPPHKPFHQAKASQPEDQRIVSPETDSGFVGSEASRVSPLTRTPERHPSHTGPPGMLGRPVRTPSAAVPRAVSLKKEPAPMDFVGMQASPRHTPTRGSALRGSLSQGTPSQSSSPPRWTNSVTSEMGQDADTTHTDSEVEGHSGASTYDRYPTKTRCPPTSSFLTSSPLVRAHHGVLDSRVKRDQAIRALQDEVSRLRQSLDESLLPSHSYPADPSSSPQATRTRRQSGGSARFPRSTAPIGKASEQNPDEFGESVPVANPARRVRSTSLPRDRPGLDLTSESGDSPPKPRNGRPKAALSSGQKPQRQSDMVTFRGAYTGKPYRLSTPGSPASRDDTGSDFCLNCQGTRTPSGKCAAIGLYSRESLAAALVLV